MKIKKSQLQKILTEEVANILMEQQADPTRRPVRDLTQREQHRQLYNLASPNWRRWAEPYRSVRPGQEGRTISRRELQTGAATGRPQDILDDQIDQWLVDQLGGYPGDDDTEGWEQFNIHRSRGRAAHLRRQEQHYSTLCRKFGNCPQQVLDNIDYFRHMADVAETERDERIDNYHHSARQRQYGQIEAVRDPRTGEEISRDERLTTANQSEFRRPRPEYGARRLQPGQQPDDLGALSLALPGPMEAGLSGREWTALDWAEIPFMLAPRPMMNLLKRPFVRRTAAAGAAAAASSPGESPDITDITSADLPTPSRTETEFDPSSSSTFKRDDWRNMKYLYEEDLVNEMIDREINKLFNKENK